MFGGDHRSGMIGLKSLREHIRRVRAGPSLRRFFINTLFDSTFMMLGIIVGSSISESSNLKMIVSTMVASSVALGISTGVSVYEAESLERRLRMYEMEKAMLADLDNTNIAQLAKEAAMVTSLINFLTPLLSCAVTISPFLIAMVGMTKPFYASYISVALALGILFSAGAYIGRNSKVNPWMKGFRMVIFGSIAFMLGYLLERAIKGF